MGNENSTHDSSKSNGTCEIMRGGWLKDEIDPVLLDEGVPVILERTQTRLRLTRRWCLEWEEEKGTVEVELESVMFHNLIDADGKIGIEINSVLSNSFQPETRLLFFLDEDDRQKVVDLLKKSQELIQKKMIFSTDLVNMFLQREFKSLKPKVLDGVKKIKRKHIKGYFKRTGMKMPKNALSDDHHWSFEDWKNVYKLMMGQQTSKVLQSVFRHNSVWCEENMPWKMTPKNLEDFLRKHQQESHSSAEVSDIMLRHKTQVILSTV